MAHATAVEQPATNGASLSEGEVRLINAYWRAANYLSVGQILSPG